MKIIDLSHFFSVDDDVFPGSEEMTRKQLFNVDENGCNLTMVTVNPHAGTHTDAPCHFIKEGNCLSDIPIERYVGKCYVADCRNKGFENAVIDVEDLKPFENEIKKAGRVILATGWSKNFGKNNFFTAFPTISPELAKYLLKLNVDLLGLESPSPSIAHNEEIHKLLLENEVVIVESLNNTESIIGEEVFLCCAPIKFREMDGFPVRAFAINDN